MFYVPSHKYGGPFGKDQKGQAIQTVADILIHKRKRYIELLESKKQKRQKAKKKKANELTT